jgi:hypothetical protein
MLEEDVDVGGITAESRGVKQIAAGGRKLGINVAAALKPERGHGKAEGGSRNWKLETGNLNTCQRALAGNQATGRLRGRLHKQPVG